MDDRELLETVESMVMFKMLTGCELDSHLGNKPDPGSWQVCMRADTACRLLDLAKRGADAQA